MNEIHHFYATMSVEQVECSTLASEKNNEINPMFMNCVTLLIILGMIILIIFLIPQFVFSWILYDNSTYLNGTVISPFDSIVEEYSPKSLKPCSYPVLENYYNNTFPCHCKYDNYNIEHNRLI